MQCLFTFVVFIFTDFINFAKLNIVKQPLWNEPNFTRIGTAAS